MSPNHEAHSAGGVAPAADGSSRSDPMLEALVGRSRDLSRTRSAGADAVNLVNLVDSAVVNSSPTAMYVGGPAHAKLKKPRRYRRVDWVSAIAAGVAVVSVAVTAVFTGVQVASADPAADAVEILASDEASLAGAEKSLTTSTSNLQESITTALADAALIRAALAELAATEEHAETADPADLHSAVQAVDSYTAALGQAVVPTPPPPYERGRVDEDSLASVGEAINRVQEASTALEDASDELRTARTAVDALGTTYTGQLATFAQTLTTYAAAENEAHPVAGQEFRDAVTAAATAVTATALNGASGAAVLTAFRDAVLALREEDRRVREVEEREREREQSQNNQQPVTPTPAPDPGTDPGTTDPGGTDPGTTPPEETDPIGGDGLLEG